MLKCKENVNSELYCTQLEMVYKKLLKIRPALVNRSCVLFLHDNSKPHTSKMTQEKIKELQWEVLPHPPYSSNLAPSDFHLFRSMENFLRNQKFKSLDDVDLAVSQCIDLKNPKLFSDGFDQVPSCWQKVIDCNGDYFVE